MSRRVEIPDETLLNLAKAGYSVSGIAKLFECHISTVTNKLNEAQIAVLDSRTNHLETIVNSLEPEETVWLIDELTAFDDIRQLLTRLIKNAYTESTTNTSP